MSTAPESSGRHVRWAGLVLASLLAGCGDAPDPMRYRLAHSGDHWDVASGVRIVDDLRELYPEFFEVILDPGSTHDPDLRAVRDDLEGEPVDRRNYDALHAVAVAYFELNYRAHAKPGGATYLADSFRAAKLVAVPWRAYGRVEDGGLRDAILDFFEDAGSGEKLGTAATAPRLGPIVASLEAKETGDPLRRARIRRLSERLTGPPPGGDR
jgi:hypothetical protein